MKKSEITKRVERVGSLYGINQAIRLISNLGGVVIGYDGSSVDFLEGSEYHSILFSEMENGRIVAK